jgi:hypothetical protein
MKNEDFERLKAVCEKEGFKIRMSSPWNQTYKITKNNPWEGVEFIEFVDINLKGYIYKVHSIESMITYIDRHNSYGYYYSRCYKEMVKPSTEQEYVEQLKKEAFERFGLKEVGDQFFINNSYGTIPNLCGKSDYYDYDKKTDSLFYKGVLLYQKGKWAEKVEKSEVFFRVLKKAPNEFTVVFEANKNFENKEEVAEMLASYLEKYLNDEI